MARSSLAQAALKPGIETDSTHHHTVKSLPCDTCIVTPHQMRGVILGIPLLNLRPNCDTEVDDANPIEPSTMGRAKIASMITGWCGGMSSRQQRSPLQSLSNSRRPQRKSVEEVTRRKVKITA